ncbi:MAG: 2-amino-4-hydroxy-6-hydroxymethyldihydropteridine diphosphokinase [Acetobacteraceae bacterium]
MDGPIFIAIGANLPGPDGLPARQTCARAAAALGEIAGLALLRLSSWYATAPDPPSGQPDYVNGVAELAGAMAPAALLAHLMAIEAGFGRVRTVANAARTLDLDIVAMGALVRAAPDPVLPHPRAHLRAFVMVPLAELAPDWRHPLLGATAAAIAAGLPRAGIRRLAD